MSKYQLSELCKKYGVNLRKHTKEIYGWTDRALTVIDLDENEKKILLEKGAESLDKYLNSNDCFSFPSLEIIEPRIIEVTSDVKNISIACPKNIAYLNKFAEKLQSAIQKITGVKVTIYTDVEIDVDKSNHVIVLGGNHENQISENLSYDNLSYADSALPGKNGYLIHTLHGLRKIESNIILTAFDESVENEVLEVFTKNLKEISKDQWVFGRIHCSKIDEENKEYFGPNEVAFKSILPEVPISYEEYSLENELFKSYVKKKFDSGGIDVNHYNLRLVYCALRSFHLWNYTDNQKFLEIYKSIVWGLIEYHLKTPEGASYISDMDFPLGELIATWSMAEADAIFNDEERIIITGALLSIVRQVFRYTKKYWPIGDNEIRFNHETFPGMSLLRASNYFGRFYQTDDAKTWREYSDYIFSGPIGRIFKHTENANDYQWLTPMHKIMYDLSSGKLEVIKNKIICKTAYACVVVTDNFGYAIHYGDAGTLLGLTNLGGLNLIEIAANVGDDGQLAWVGELIRSKTTSKILLGCRTEAQSMMAQKIKVATEPPAFGDWEALEMDDHFRTFYQENFPKKYLLDKLAFRTGWDNDDQYFCLEPQSVAGHMHFDMNSILRYNHLGRVWLVDNGYGRPSGLKNVAQSFNQRERGPEDHNLVIFKNKKDELVIPPPFCGVIGQESVDDFQFCQSALCNIDGANWLRSIVILKNRFLLVIDQVQASGSESEIECQFNILGEDQLKDQLWQLSQEGVNLFVQFDDRAEVKRDFYSNGTWDDTFEQKTYPYAKDNVKKLRRKISNPEKNERIHFVSLFEANKKAKSSYQLMNDNKNEIIIHGPFDKPSSFKTENLSLIVSDNELKIELQENWLLPDDLTVEMFGDFGERKSKIR